MEVKLAAVKQHLPPAPIMTWARRTPYSILPHTWSVTMACYAYSAPMTTVWTRIVMLFAVSEVFRAAGCVINDMLDKDLDALVRRPFSFRLGISCLGLVALYPLMKRVTYWPQVVLGMCINWGMLVGAASVVGAVDWHVYTPLHGGHMLDNCDINEDIKHGMRSATIIFGEKIRPILAMFTIRTVGLPRALYVNYAVGLSGTVHNTTTRAGNRIPYYRTVQWHARTVNTLALKLTVYDMAGDDKERVVYDVGIYTSELSECKQWRRVKYQTLSYNVCGDGVRVLDDFP
ncbi:hypothetical protein M405DRAFT_838539 [Rhizopogon salebrosus TDB-379]|nr:hypothetical protein M405DRAFT_838539 [Rhizopogon salebrosus TDB-379]